MWWKSVYIFEEYNSQILSKERQIDMPLKSDAVKDLDILPVLPFNERIV